MAQQWRIRLQCRSHRRPRFHPWVRKIPWRRKWQPTSRFLPGESHGQRSLVDYSPVGSQRVWQDWAAKHICSYHRWRVQAHLNWGFLPKSSPSLFFFFFWSHFQHWRCWLGYDFSETQSLAEAHTDCWQNSIICGWRTGLPIFLLAAWLLEAIMVPYHLTLFYFVKAGKREALTLVY